MNVTSDPPSSSTLRDGSVPLSARVADYAVLALALALGGGSIVLFAWPGRPVLVTLGFPRGGALLWNAAWSILFFVQHSVLVRRSVRSRLATVIPARYDGACYAITSGIALALAVALQQPGGAPLFVLEGLPRLAVTAVSLAAVCGFIWGIAALRTFDPLGLRPIRAHLRGESTAPVAGATDDLVVRGPYRLVRHPLYSFLIVLFWANPEMTASHLLLAALWTTWIYVGARLEERDLVAAFGDRYRRYQSQVPILVPWRGRL